MIVDNIPLSLYVHWPWCVQKCPYCDFNSHKAQTDLVDDYIAVLLKDWQLQYDQFGFGRKISSIFFGGGTPSLASPSVISQLLEQIDRIAGMDSDIEITLEANPGTADADHFAGYYAAGVNRLSLGVQSFDNELLQKIGRIHDQNQVFQAIEWANAVGFKRLNLDLMTGLPSQSMEQAISDIETAISIAPEHLSLYQLTIEPNTPFFSKPPNDLLDEDDADDLQIAVHRQAELAGYQRYEVSAWAKTMSAQSRHNVNYWQFGDYIGIGAGAHGKITMTDGRVVRTQTHKVPYRYIQDVQLSDALMYANQSVIPDNDLAFEFLLNALRLTKGVSASLFKERTGLSLSLLESRWSVLVDHGLLEAIDDRLVTTADGYRHLNAVLSQWLA